MPVEIRQISPTTMKISLSSQELAAFQVNFAALDRNSPETAALLAAVVEAAERQSRLPLREARLFVEAFGQSDGSCLLYLSMIDTPEQSSCAKSAMPVLICDFSTPQELFSCCCRLRRMRLDIVRSALYVQPLAESGGLRLLLELSAAQEARIQRVLSEFGTPQRAGRVSLGITAEHFVCVQKQRAVTEIARWQCS